MNNSSIEEHLWETARSPKDFVRKQPLAPQITEETALRHALSLGAIAKLTFGQLQQSDEIEIVQLDFLKELKVSERDYLLQQALLSVIKDCAGMSIAEYKVEANNHIAFYNKNFVGELYGMGGLTLKESIRCVAQYFYHRNILLAL